MSKEASSNLEKSAETPSQSAIRQDASEIPAPLIHGADVTAVGDSVMLASAPEISARFVGVSLDTEVSRSLRPIIVMGLATNGPISGEDLYEIKQRAGHSLIILVNVYGDRWWIPKVNEQIDAFAAKHRGVVVADRNGEISPHPEFLAGDLIHPHASGAEICAETIATAIAELQTAAETIGFDVPRR